MRDGDRPTDQLGLMKGGLKHEDVRDVHAAFVGVVQHDDVAGRDLPQIGVEDRRDGVGDRAEMHRDRLALRQHAALGVTARRREVHDVLDDFGVRSLDHRVSHLVDERR